MGMITNIAVNRVAVWNNTPEAASYQLSIALKVFIT